MDSKRAPVENVRASEVAVSDDVAVEEELPSEAVRDAMPVGSKPPAKRRHIIYDSDNA